MMKVQICCKLRRTKCVIFHYNYSVMLSVKALKSKVLILVILANRILDSELKVQCYLIVMITIPRFPTLRTILESESPPTSTPLKILYHIALKADLCYCKAVYLHIITMTEHIVAPQVKANPLRHFFLLNG